MLGEVALREQNPRPLTQTHLEMILAQITRLEKSVQQFLNFSRPPTLARRLSDLSAVGAQALALIRPRAEQQQVVIAYHRPDQPLWRHVDPDQLGNVLVNLFLNALDAMPNGGRLTLVLEINPQGETIFTLVDTGPGIPSEMAKTLFIPFASSKAHGTGLGLWNSRLIVEDHGGSIMASNNPGGGAQFTITLPVEQQKESECQLS